MHKRLTLMLVPLAAAAVLLPATPAAASCPPEARPSYVVCTVKSTPYWDLCVALGVCS